MLFSPLETFELHLYSPLPFPLDLSLSNGTLFLFICFGLLLGFALVNLPRSFLVPTSFQLVLEGLYSFILTMIREQTASAALPFFPLIFLVFSFIILSNLLGLFPFSFTLTAQFALTFALALSFNLAFLFQGFASHGLTFLRLFVPSEAPAVLVPLIVAIEVVSYTIRTFSLSIRLFANMMAGHTLLHILATFALKMAQSGGLLLFVALLPFLLVMAVFVLEFAIALIQAYVFAILLCIYANDAYHPGH